jgi:hypothetical protein
MICIRSELSKNAKPYFTFLGGEGCEILKEYLERRLAHGEVLTPNSGVIASALEAEDLQKRFGIEDKSEILRTVGICKKIKEAMQRSGLGWLRPYVEVVF